MDCLFCLNPVNYSEFHIYCCQCHLRYHKECFGEWTQRNNYCKCIHCQEVGLQIYDKLSNKEIKKIMFVKKYHINFLGDWCRVHNKNDLCPYVNI